MERPTQRIEPQYEQKPQHEIESETMLARCCLHELDHLDGITFLSKMTPADKLANRRALRSLEERYGEDAA